MMNYQTNIKSKEQDNKLPWQQNQGQKIEIYTESQGYRQLLYTMPKPNLKENQKIFHPGNWCIGDFQIGRHLGKGKYGHVYLVRERSSKMICALKVLSKRQIIKSDIIFQIRRQIQIHSHLNHKNILKMYGFFYDQKRIYIILDYAPKGQLYNILRKQSKFTEQRAANYIYQMIQALQYCHGMKIMHRDIKPENILLSTNDQIRLTDFGWSIHVSDNSKRRNTFCGTPDYISPQIAFQKPYDYRIDLWCLGVLTFQFAAGYPPFEGYQNRKELIKKIQTTDYKFPSHFSPQLRNFIASLLKLKAQERMPLSQAVKHPWIKKYSSEFKQTERVQSSENQPEQQINYTFIKRDKKINVEYQI